MIDHWKYMTVAIREYWQNREKAQALARQDQPLAECMNCKEIAEKYLAHYATLP